jgi:hypothetical protein
MAYTPIGWQDLPSEETPISADNLNHMDEQIKANADALVPASTDNIGLVKPDGDTITVDEDGTIHSIGGGGGGTTDYNRLSNKPKINNQELTGNVTLSQIGAQPSGTYITPSDIATSSKIGLVKPDGTTTTIDADGTLHAAGGSGGAPTWSEISNKPFESIGSGLSVSDGVLSATGGGGSVPDNVTLFEAGDTNQLKDKNGNNLIPITKTKAVSDDAGNRLDNTLTNLTNLVNNKASANLVSDAYNPSTTYSEGHYCIYNNILWRSKVSNNAGNTPAEGSYWTATNVGKNLVTTNGEGKFGYLGADDSFIPFKSGGGSWERLNLSTYGMQKVSGTGSTTITEENTFRIETGIGKGANNLSAIVNPIDLTDYSIIRYHIESSHTGAGRSISVNANLGLGINRSTFFKSRVCNATAVPYGSSVKASEVIDVSDLTGAYYPIVSVTHGNESDQGTVLVSDAYIELLKI